MQQFLTNSDRVKDIMRGLSMTSSLFVSSIIVGQAHTGKRNLIKQLFPDITTLEGTQIRDIKEVEERLHEFDELIIFDFHKLPRRDKLDFGNKRIIATAESISKINSIDEQFAFIYHMPPLSQRLEDVKLYCDIFMQEAKEKINCKDCDIDISYEDVDISDNIKSLRADIYKRVFSNSLSEDDIMNILRRYFEDENIIERGYKDNLSILEIPLLKAGMKIFNSQLQLSKALGINRNTLRKKINEYAIN